MNEPDKGDLVWVPSAITLLQFGNSDAKVVNRFIITEKPTNALLIKKGKSNSPYHEIFYGGEHWHVLKKDVT